jgi:hypothetical protein
LLRRSPGGESGPRCFSSPTSIVPAREDDDLICESCRSRIRGEALERKIEAERAGRRGMLG